MTTGDIRLRLQLEARHPFGCSDVPAITLAATLTDLTVLYDLAAKAWDFQLPIANLLIAVRTVDPMEPGALEPPQDLAAYLWTAARLLPVQHPQPPDLSPSDLARLQEHVILYRPYGVLRVQALSVGSPIEVEFRVPGAEVERNGAVWVFLDAIEELFSAHGRIERRMAQDAMGYREDEHDNRVRHGVALQHLALLNHDTADVDLAAGEAVAS